MKLFWVQNEMSAFINFEVVMKTPLKQMRKILSH